VKKLLFLTAVLTVSAAASTIGTCVPGALSGYIGNACAFGGKVFDNLQDFGEPGAARLSTHFQTAATLGPQTGTGFFTAQSFPGQIGMQAEVSPVFSAAELDAATSFGPGNSGHLVTADSPGPASTLGSDTDTGNPTSTASTSSIVTASTVTGSGGAAAASSGSSSFAVGAVTLVPEPAPTALVATGLLCFGLLRKRAA